MPISAYLKRLRARVGTALVLMPGVAAIVRDAQGHVLLARRSDNGQWMLPGGAVDPGEAPAQALVREIWEETGLRVRPERVAGVFGGKEGFRVVYPNGDEAEYTVILFECRVAGGAIAPRDGEITEARFFPPAEIPALRAPYPRALLAAPAADPCFQWDDRWLEALAD